MTRSLNRMGRYARQRPRKFQVRKNLCSAVDRASGLHNVCGAWVPSLDRTGPSVFEQRRAGAVKLGAEFRSAAWLKISNMLSTEPLHFIGTWCHNLAGDAFRSMPFCFLGLYFNVRKSAGAAIAPAPRPLPGPSTERAVSVQV